MTDARPAPRFGILTFPTLPFSAVEAEWKWAEQIGFDHGWVTDSFINRRLGDFEPWTLLAALARTTSRMRIGTLVTTTIPRHPVLLAANVITVDHVSGGRVELGIGAGDQPEEIEAFGAPLLTNAGRIQRLEEQLEVLDHLLRGHEVTRSGVSSSTRGAMLAPPVQLPRPPLVISAEGPRALRLAARYGDGWSTLGGQWAHGGAGGRASEDEALRRTREKVERLALLCAELGRPAASVRRIVLAYRQPVDPLSSIDAFDHFVGTYGETGIDEFVFYWPPVSNMKEKRSIEAERRAVVERIAVDRMALAAT